MVQVQYLEVQLFFPSSTTYCDLQVKKDLIHNRIDPSILLYIMGLMDLSYCGLSPSDSTLSSNMLELKVESGVWDLIKGLAKVK